MGKDRFSPREAELDHCYTHKRHRRLAKAGSPATARVCGELAKGSPRRARCLNSPNNSYCRHHKEFLRYSPTAATHENDLPSLPSPPHQTRASPQPTAPRCCTQPAPPHANTQPAPHRAHRATPRKHPNPHRTHRAFPPTQPRASPPRIITIFNYFCIFVTQ